MRAYSLSGSFTGSLLGIATGNLVTASSSPGGILFTVGDGSTFTVPISSSGGTTIDTGSFVTTSSFNNFTSSYNTTSQSLNNQVVNLTAATSSYLTTSSYNQSTGSFATTSSLNALTSSFNTFTSSYQTDSASFSSSISSLIGVTGSFTTTSSFNTFTSSYQTDSASFSSSISSLTGVTGSYTLTSSFNTFTSSYNTFTSSYSLDSASFSSSISSLTNKTGSYTLTSSFNVFTSSYSTGSFTGSFTGSLSGTASYAVNANQSLFATNASNTLVTVVNKSGADIPKGKVVYVSGAQGGRVAVDLANASDETTSASTIGLTYEDIANNQEGYIITSGLLDKIDTTGGNLTNPETWNDGDTLYLSPFFAGEMTNVKPQAVHLVVIGWIGQSNDNNGNIEVKVDNGWELDELHNVYYDQASLTGGEVLAYDAGTGLWIASLTASYAASASQAISSSQAITSSYYQETDPIFVSKSGSYATTGSNVFTGSQIITGSITTRNSVLTNRGTGATGATTNLLLQDSSGNSLVTVLNNGVTSIAQQTTVSGSVVIARTGSLSLQNAAGADTTAMGFWAVGSSALWLYGFTRWAFTRGGAVYSEMNTSGLNVVDTTTNQGRIQSNYGLIFEATNVSRTEPIVTVSGSTYISGVGIQSRKWLSVQNNTGAYGPRTGSFYQGFVFEPNINLSGSTTLFTDASNPLPFHIVRGFFHSPTLSGSQQTVTSVRAFESTTGSVIINGGQLGIGVTTSSLAPITSSAALEVQSTSQGILFPRMLTSQRDAIANPVAGLVIFNTTTNKLECYASGIWNALF